MAEIPVILLPWFRHHSYSSFIIFADKKKHYGETFASSCRIYHSKICHSDKNFGQHICQGRDVFVCVYGPV